MLRKWKQALYLPILASILGNTPLPTEEKEYKLFFKNDGFFGDIRVGNITVDDNTLDLSALLFLHLKLEQVNDSTYKEQFSTPTISETFTYHKQGTQWQTEQYQADPKEKTRIEKTQTLDSLFPQTYQSTMELLNQLENNTLSKQPNFLFMMRGYQLKPRKRTRYKSGKEKIMYTLEGLVDEPNDVYILDRTKGIEVTFKDNEVEKFSLHMLKKKEGDDTPITFYGKLN